MILRRPYETHRDIVKLQQNKFTPPFCPNEDCECHMNPTERFFIKKGWYSAQRFPYVNRAYQCKTCRKKFSYSYFQLEYREKRVVDNELIFNLFCLGASNSEIARRLECSERLVRERIEKLARWGMIEHSARLNRIRIQEPVVYDGAENFSYSQYDPNNINHMIGKDSQFIYDFGFAAFSRKGMMSDRQKIVLEDIEKKHGRYPKKEIRWNTAAVVRRTFEKTINPLHGLMLHSDEHYLYKEALYIDLADLNIYHYTTSAKRYRNFMNPLFPVNHTDMLLRQHVSAFKRETISFSKRPTAMVNKYILFMIWKNYMRPMFTKKHRWNSRTNTDSPAMFAGAADKIHTVKSFFKTRRTLTQAGLSKEWLGFFRKTVPQFRLKTLPYWGV